MDAACVLEKTGTKIIHNNFMKGGGNKINLIKHMFVLYGFISVLSDKNFLARYVLSSAFCSPIRNVVMHTAVTYFLHFHSVVPGS